MDTSYTVSITFLFADPGESLFLWEQHPETMQTAVPRFRAILQQAVAHHGGEVFNFSTDTLQAAFSNAPGAVNAALEAQRTLLSAAWGLPLSPRLALLTGSALRQGDEFFGPAPHRAARLLSVANGGQVLLSHITADLARDNLPDGVSLLDLGEHRLPDLTHPERLFQLAAPGLPAEFPPLKSLNNQTTNLPIQPNPLVGRQADLQAVLHLLHSTDVRLLTLTGIGGTGKTRLALQAAADLLAAFPDGVFFVPLEQIADPTLVASAAVQALSLDLSVDQTIEEALLAHLRTRQTLLVLDNFEHLLPAASLVSTLLSACPQLKVLATSREALHLRGEHEFPVSPLPLPDQSQLPDQLAQFASVTLFIQRAQAVRPDFNVDNTSAPAVAEICAFLDGLPLAIELAAARMRLFSPQVLLARLKAQPNLQLLSSGRGDLPERQQTMQNTLEWSYNLLNPTEQALFRRLGVFAGGFTLEAVEAICFQPEEAPENALDLLSSLVDKSLIRANEGGEQPRFAMLFILRQYALGLLEMQGELAILRVEHCAYFLTLAELAEPELITNNRTHWFAILDLEHDNLRLALNWAISNQKVETGLRLANSLWRFWWHRVYLREGLNWIEQILPLAESHNAPANLHVKVLKGAAALAVFLGDFSTGTAYGEQALAISRGSGNRQLIAESSANLGYDLIQQGKTQHGAQLLEESIVLFREIGDRRNLAIALNKRAILAMDQKNYPLAQEMLQECLALMRDREDIEGVGHALSGLGLVELYQGNYERSKNLFEESFRIEQSLGLQISAMEDLFWIGTTQLLQGNLLAAQSHYEQAFKAFQQFGIKRGIAENLEGLAGVASARGDPQRAARMFGAAEALRDVLNLPLPPSDHTIFDPMINKVQSQMKKNDFAESWEAGRQLATEDLESLIKYALEPEAAPGEVSGKAISAGLTAREAEILRLLAQGLADLQIAEKLVISPRTVNAHLTSIYSKLGVNSRAAATRFAVENGIA